MKFIVDTNIIISALIKDSMTRKILVESGWRFYYPQESLQELEKYRSLILEKSELSEEEYIELYNFLTDYIFIIPFDKVNEKFEEANVSLGKIDSKDVIFLALALSIKNDGVWSDDFHFQRQNRVRVWKTEDVVREFESLRE